jgi:hypothetical protein
MDARQKVQLNRRLLFARKWCQIVGAIFIIPTVVLGWLMSLLHIIPISFAPYLLWTLGIGLVFCAASIVCTLTFNGMKNAATRRMMKNGEIK